VITTSQPAHPDPQSPVHRIRIPITDTMFLENQTLADSLYAISPSVDVDSFRSFVDALTREPPDITHASIADLLSLVVEL
jgi:hypothetical protein